MASHAAYLDEQENELCSSVTARLHRSLTPYYRSLSEEELQRRACDLVASFLQALAQRPSALARYIEEIVPARMEAGVPIQEIQTTLNALELKAWQLVADSDAGSALVPTIERIATVIGDAKDMLATSYVRMLRWGLGRDLTDESHEPDPTLLSGGTDPMPLLEVLTD
jgi:hypothetical protein